MIVVIGFKLYKIQIETTNGLLSAHGIWAIRFITIGTLFVMAK